VFNWEYISQFFPFIFSIIVYSIIHSVLASNFFKKAIEKLFSNYRLFFNAVATITLLGPIYFYLRLKAFLLFDFLFLKIIGVVITFFGVWVMKQSFKNYSLSHFLGIEKNQNTIAPNLIIDGWNKKVRHPLYFGSILAIWGWFLVSPTDKFLVLAIFSTLYFIIGVQFEEKRLIREFGEAYKKYQIKVPKLIPKFFTALLAFGFMFFVTSCSSDVELPVNNQFQIITIDSAFVTTFQEVPTSQKVDRNLWILMPSNGFGPVQIEVSDSVFQLYIFGDLSINLAEKTINGKNAYKTRFFSALNQNLKSYQKELNSKIGNPQECFDYYLETLKNLKTIYQKTFLKKDTLCEKLFRAKVLAFQLKSSTYFLQNWQPDSNIFRQEKLQQEFIKSINKLDEHVIYDDGIFVQLKEIISHKAVDTSRISLVSVENLNNKLAVISTLNLKEKTRKIFHFRLLIESLVDEDITNFELENTNNYGLLEIPSFYKKLHEIKAKTSNINEFDMQEKVRLNSDSIALDSIALIQ